MGVFGSITCPHCGARFSAMGGPTVCPKCGRGLADPVGVARPAALLQNTRPEPGLFSFSGRISRSSFWVVNIALLLVNVAMRYLVVAIASGGYEAIQIAMALWALFAIPCVWIGLATQAKRWHDLGFSAWMVLLVLIPLAGTMLLWLWVPAAYGVVVLAWLGFVRGSKGTNRYGDDPLLETTSAPDVAAPAPAPTPPPQQPMPPTPTQPSPTSPVAGRSTKPALPATAPATREPARTAADYDDSQMLGCLRDLANAYTRNERDRILELEPVATQIGQELNRRGGLPEMRRMWERLGGMPGARTLDMHWDGIGEWRG